MLPIFFMGFVSHIVTFVIIGLSGIGWCCYQCLDSKTTTGKEESNMILQ